MSDSARSTFRFGEFELDLSAYELRRADRQLKLGRQPMELLILLIERHRQLVSRREIVDRLWGTEVFVDTETGVNTAVSRIRQVLQDPATAPKFLETVPGKGYRFIAPVQIVGDPPPAGATIAVLPFDNLTSDDQREYLAAGLTDETSASLPQIDPVRLRVKGRTLRYRGTTKSVAEIGRELCVDFLVASSLRAAGIRLRLTVTLIRVADEEHVWSQIYDREASDLLGLQQELSAAIAQQIHLHLSSERMNGVERRQTRDPRATMRICVDGSRRTGARRMATRGPSGCTNRRSTSTRHTRWRGRIWRSPVPRPASTAMPPPPKPAPLPAPRRGRPSRPIRTSRRRSWPPHTRCG